MLLTGCVYSHRNTPLVARPVPAVVVPTPTSDRPAVRVYTDPEPVIIPDSPPARVVVTTADSNLEVANRIRRVFETDPTLAMKARNVAVTVDGGRVTLRGRVDSESDRQLLRRTIGQLSGVDSVDTSDSVVIR